MAVIRCVLSPCSCEPIPPALQAFAREPFEPLPLLGYMGRRLFPERSRNVPHRRSCPCSFVQAPPVLSLTLPYPPLLNDLSQN